MTHSLSLSVFIAFKGTNFYILLPLLHFCIAFKIMHFVLILVVPEPGRCLPFTFGYWRRVATFCYGRCHCNSLSHYAKIITLGTLISFDDRL